MLKERHAPRAVLFLFLIPNLCYNIGTCMPMAFFDEIGRTRFTFSITGAIYEEFRYSQGAAEEAIHFQVSAGLSLRDLLHRSCGRGGRIFCVCLEPSAGRGRKHHAKCVLAHL